MVRALGWMASMNCVTFNPSILDQKSHRIPNGNHCDQGLFSSTSSKLVVLHAKLEKKNQGTCIYLKNIFGTNECVKMQPPSRLASKTRPCLTKAMSSRVRASGLALVRKSAWTVLIKDSACSWGESKCKRARFWLSQAWTWLVLTFQTHALPFRRSLKSETSSWCVGKVIIFKRLELKHKCRVLRFTCSIDKGALSIRSMVGIPPSAWAWNSRAQSRHRVKDHPQGFL